MGESLRCPICGHRTNDIEGYNGFCSSICERRIKDYRGGIIYNYPRQAGKVRMNAIAMKIIHITKRLLIPHSTDINTMELSASLKDLIIQLHTIRFGRSETFPAVRTVTWKAEFMAHHFLTWQDHFKDVHKENWLVKWWLKKHPIQYRHEYHSQYFRRVYSIKKDIVYPDIVVPKQFLGETEVVHYELLEEDQIS